MKHELIITTLLATTLTVSAQEEGRNMAAIGFGASHDSWNIELDYDYMVFPYAGIGIGAQFDRENGDGGLLGEIIREELRGDDYYDDYDDEHEIKLNIVPHLTLRTPAIRLKKIQDKGDGLLLEVQPAVVIFRNAPEASSAGAPAWHSATEAVRAHCSLATTSPTTTSTKAPPATTITTAPSPMPISCPFHTVSDDP